MDFLNTSSYSRSSLCLCCELWKWRIGRPCKHEHEVLAAFCNVFHRFWRESFLCNRFKRVVAWIKRDIDIFRGAFAGSLQTATMKDVYIALQSKESRSRLCCPSVSTIHQLLNMCFPKTSSIHAHHSDRCFRRSIPGKTLVRTENDKIIDLICSLDDQIPPHVPPWEWGGIASAVMQDLWNGIIYAEYETCGTTSSNKFQTTPVPNLPHVVIPVVLHFISLVVFCSAGRLKITNAEG